MNRTPIERPQKRLRTFLSRPSPWQTLGQETVSGLSESRCSHISHWAQVEHVWPDDFFRKDEIDEDKMQRVLARKKSSASLRRKRSEPSLITQSSATPSDQRPREEKSAPYRHARYELQLRERGIFMDKHGKDITDNAKRLCQKLLETPQTLPQDSLFKDELFEETCDKMQNRNESRVIRDIAPLIVPSAEILAIRGAKHLRILTETVNEGWNNSIPLLGPRPQPDYSVGFKRESFNQDQLRKLQPLIGELDDQSLFVATYDMYLPFLTAEVKCGAAALDIADRQNMHSMTLGLTGLVELFRLLGREDELHGEINCFSVSHNDETVRIYGHYAVINGTETTFHRRVIRKFDFTDLQGKEKWTAYTFVKNVYDIWVPTHFKRICAAIDDLPAEQEFDVSIASGPHVSNTNGLSQPLENHNLEALSNQPSDNNLQPMTPDTSVQPEKPAYKKKKRK